jgi:ABC-2 type transport system permease protein
VSSHGVHLREVKGPSALGGGWQRFAELLYLISVTEFKKTYFGTVLGYLWSLLRPLMLFAVLLFVFTKIFRIGSEVPHYAVLLLFNVVLFGFFSEATSNAVTAVVGQEGIVRKTQFPRLVIPLSVVLTSLFNLCVNFLIVIVFILASGIEPQWSWFLFPVAVFAVFVLATTMAMGMSSLYVRFRDTAIIWGVIATALFYATPVLYPIEFVPDEYRKFILANPLTPIFEQARQWVIDPSAPGAVEASGGGLRLLIPVGIYIAICVLGVWIFRREAPRIAEEL